MSEEKLLDKKTSRSSNKSSSSKRKSSKKKNKSLDLEQNHDDDHTTAEADDEYSQFLKQNKVMWKTMTLLSSLGFFGLAAGTYVINTNEEGNCLGIEGALWLIMVNQVVNACVSFLFFTGMERSTCSAFSMTVFCVLQITVLFYSSTIYFEAMSPTPDPVDPT
jgi:hypothetical protein